jgi:hypothetical protein
MILSELHGAKYVHYWDKRELLIVSFDEGTTVHIYNYDGEEAIEVDIGPTIPLKNVDNTNIEDAVTMYIEVMDTTVEDLHAKEEDYYDGKKQDKYLEEDFDYKEYHYDNDNF